MPNLRLLAATAGLASIALGLAASIADAATITVSYERGYRGVLINDYGASGLGTFRLEDGGQRLVALCVEAAEPHSTAVHAYAPVPNQHGSPELDALVWIVAQSDAAGSLDNDTALAAAALAWFYADAIRTIGVPVWSNGARGFARISPISPDGWQALPQFSRSYPVGLRAGGANLDAAERRVVDLFHHATAWRGPWTLTADPATSRFRLTGPAGPIGGRRVQVTVETAAGTTAADVATDASGWAVVATVPAGARVTASAESPGVHREWDGSGVQRMVTATSQIVTARFETAPTTTAPTTTTTSTTTTTTSTTTTAPPTTTTTEPATTTTSSTTTSSTPTSTTTSTTTTTEATTTSTTTEPTTTTEAATTTTEPIVEQAAPTTTTVPPPVETLPRTGSGEEAARLLLRLGDAGFVIGVGLVALAGLLPGGRVSRRGVRR